MNRLLHGLWIALVIIVGGSPASAQPASEGAEGARTEKNRWLLVCCGLPGDNEHRERLTAACRKIIAAAEPVLGVPSERLQVLVGDESMREALAGSPSEPGICTRESLAAVMQRLSAEVQRDDACWILMLGHSHLYDTHSWFNVAGPDFDQSDLAQWAKPLTCSEQVIWLTMPVSGFWITPLADESRVIISATEADLEYTGTEMPYALADVLAGDASHQPLEDVDGDGELSLLDLYLATNLEITGRFRVDERLQTEHAQLEDNGDGRGSEVQQEYLPAEEIDGGDDSPKLPGPIRSEVLDGFRSRKISVSAPQIASELSPKTGSQDADSEDGEAAQDTDAE